MSSKFILCHKWDNNSQNYVSVGNLLHNDEFFDDRGVVGFYYDEEYINKSGANLDPNHLRTNIKSGTYSVPANQPPGTLPHYFQQFLPGNFSGRILNQIDPSWSSTTQFEKLLIISEIIGDHHSILLQGHNDHFNCDIDNMKKLERLVSSCKRFKDDYFSSEEATVSEILPLLNIRSNRPMFDYYDIEQRKRYVVKMNASGYCNDAAVSALLGKVEEKAGINVSNSEVRVLSYGEPLLFQECFASISPSDTKKIKHKFNRISFKFLLSEFSGTTNVKLTYKHIAAAIKQYSVNPEFDLEELFRRAYFSASVNHTSNGPDNLELIDIGSNEWRLAPSYNNLPNPFHSTSFETCFDAYMTSRNLFNIDEQFIAKLAQEISITSTSAFQIANYVDQAIKDIPQLIQSSSLTNDDISMLRKAMPTAGIDKSFTTKTSTGPSIGM